jgi:hypothetical protein
VWCNHLGPPAFAGCPRAKNGSARAETNNAAILQSFIFFSPPHGAALDSELFRARAGNARAKVEHFNCHLIERVSESSSARSDTVLTLRWQTSC